MHQHIHIHMNDWAGARRSIERDEGLEGLIEDEQLKLAVCMSMS